MSDIHNPDYRLPDNQNANRPATPPHLPPGPAWQPPNYYQPQPHTFGTPAPPAPPATGQPWPVPATWPGTPPQTPPPLPSVGTIWVNIIIFGWFFGIGLIYGCYKAIQGISRCRQRGLSPAKYVLPLLVVAAVIVGLIVLGAMHPDNGQGGPGGFGGN
jgi:hypothetical protein